MDDDEDERENFEITDWDLQNEFNPNRQRHWQTKEEATYGVWAERDSDEERPSFGGKRYGWRGPLSPGVGELPRQVRFSPGLPELLSCDLSQGAQFLLQTKRCCLTDRSLVRVE